MDRRLPGSSSHGIFPGKNTGVGCHFLLQGNLPDPGTEPVSLASPTAADGFFTMSTTWVAHPGFKPRPIWTNELSPCPTLNYPILSGHHQFIKRGQADSALTWIWPDNVGLLLFFFLFSLFGFFFQSIQFKYKFSSFPTFKNCWFHDFSWKLGLSWQLTKCAKARPVHLHVATEMLDPESITFLDRPLIPRLLLRHTSKDLSNIHHSHAIILQTYISLDNSQGNKR